MIRATIALLLMFFAFSGCSSGNDEHCFGIGEKYSFVRFCISKPKGSEFVFTVDELRLIEQSWGNAKVSDPIAVSNAITTKRQKLSYEYVLNDGFKSDFQAKYGIFDGKAYLKIDVVGDETGFPADVYTNLLPIDVVLGVERMTEFEKWLETD